MNQAAQLLNAIEADDVDRLLSDHSMIVQQKLDGIRILTHVGQEIIATNRKGEITSFDASIARALSVLPSGTVVDGEVIAGDAGPVYWLFDLLQHGGEDLRPRGYLDRYLALERALATCAGPVSLVHTARQEADKRALFLALERQGAEGVVFKRVDAPYKSGRPASGGTQLKYKFIKSADVFVTSNAGNAYQMAVYDDGRIREVGKVFAGTTNESRARIDALLAAGGRPVAEVRYLYATDGDVLYQPVFDRLREDKSPEDCVLDQLRRTNRTVVTQRAAPRDAEPRRPWIPVPPKAAARDIHRPWIPRPKG